MIKVEFNYLTIIVALIEGWTAQWYGYAPAALKKVVLLPPAGIEPVSHAPLSLVDVWGAASLFFHVIVVPRDIVSTAGLKAKPLMMMVLGSGVTVVFEAAGFELLPQPGNGMMMKKIMKIIKTIVADGTFIFYPFN